MADSEPVRRLWRKRMRSWVDVEDDLAILVDNSSEYLEILQKSELGPQWLAALALYLSRKDVVILASLLAAQKYRRERYARRCVAIILRRQPVEMHRAAVDWLLQRQESDVMGNFPPSFWEFAAIYHYKHSQTTQKLHQITDFGVKTIHLGAHSVAIVVRAAAETWAVIADFGADTVISCTPTKRKISKHSQVVCKTYVQHARLVTDGLRVAVHGGMNILKDQSHWVERGPIADSTVARLLIAGVGATGIVGDALFDGILRASSAALGSTAAVLDHWYGLPMQVLMDTRSVCQNLYLANPTLSLWSIAKTTSQRQLEMFRRRRRLERSPSLLDDSAEEDDSSKDGFSNPVSMKLHEDFELCKRVSIDSTLSDDGLSCGEDLWQPSFDNTMLQDVKTFS